MPDIEHGEVIASTRFIFDPLTDKISTTSNKRTIAQGSHQRERFIFELPRYIDGHDMSLCDSCEVHYSNVEVKTKRTIEDIYIANDLQVEGDKVIFSWLIRNTATKYVGSLSFSFHLKCAGAGAVLLYECNSLSYDKIGIGKVQGSEARAELITPDLIASLKTQVTDDATNALNARAEAGEFDGDKGDPGDSVTVSSVSESSVSGGDNVVTFSDGNTLTVKNGKDGAGVTVTDVSESTESEGGNVVTFSDGNTLTVKNGRDGRDGTDGADGAPGQDGAPGRDGTDGHTPLRGTDYWTETDKTNIVNDVLAAMPMWEGGSY